MKLNILPLSPHCILPSFGTDAAACFDLSACLPGGDALIPAGASMRFGTGLAFGIPEGFCIDIRGRSGLAFKENVHAFAGTIDADYTGEIGILLTNNSKYSFHVTHGQRIAQAKLTQVHRPQFFLVGSLEATARGDGGFGSTGA